MHVRCPHCHNPVEMVDDAELSDITCPSCGSRFSLLGEETAGYESSDSKTIGHFDLLEQVGVGAFGSVWRTRDTQLDRIVAVKIPRKDQLSPTESEQFLREARSAAQLHHPNIVSVHEVGLEDGHIYIVSDFVQGLTLANWLTGRRLTAREAAELCVKVADGLDHAHTAGIIHRDLKPGNIMLNDAGEPRIMDFGLAKREAGEITMTMDGKVLGTPAYMSPEQAKGEAHGVDGRTDIYSLGVILFELLTGERPFRGDARMLIHQVIHEEAPSPRKLNGSIPRDLETICLKCLEKEPRKRYITAQEVASEFRRYLNGEPIRGRPITSLERAWRWCLRNPRLAGVTAGAVGIIVVLSAFYFWRLLEENAQTQLAWRLEQEARLDAEIAHDQAQDNLAQSLSDQSRTVRLASLPGHRAETIRLVSEAEKLRGRNRKAPPAPGIVLPTRRQLRSEAVAALITNDARAVWEHQTLRVPRAAVSPDGRFATVAMKDAIRLVDVGDGHEIRSLGMKAIVDVTCMALGPNADLLASLKRPRDGIHLWELKSGTRIKTLAWPDELNNSSTVNELIFSPDGTHLVAVDTYSGEDGFESDLVLWNLDDDSQWTDHVSNSMPSLGARFSSDGDRLVYQSSSHTVRVRNVVAPANSVDIQLPTRVGGIAVALSPIDDVMAVSCDAGRILLWDLSKNVQIGQVSTDGACGSLTFSPNGRYLACGNSRGRITFWDLLDSSEAFQLRSVHKVSVGFIRWDLADRQVLSWGMDGGLKLWEISEQRFTSSLQSGLRRITENFAMSSDCKWLAVTGRSEKSRQEMVRLLHRGTGRLEREMALNTNKQLLASGIVRFRADGKWLVHLGRRHVIAWDTVTGEEVVRWEVDRDTYQYLYSFAFTNTGELLTSGTQREVSGLVWDASTGKPVWEAPHDVYPHLSRDGRFVFGLPPWKSETHSNLVIWERGSSRVVFELPRSGATYFSQPSLSPDGQFFAVVRGLKVTPAGIMEISGLEADACLTVYGFPSGQKHLEIGGSSTLSTYAFSPDSRLLAVGFHDGSGQLWDVEGGQEIFHWTISRWPIQHLAFGPDGAWLVSATRNLGTIRFLHLSELRGRLDEIGLNW